MRTNADALKEAQRITHSFQPKLNNKIGPNPKCTGLSQIWKIGPQGPKICEFSWISSLIKNPRQNVRQP